MSEPTKAGREQFDKWLSQWPELKISGAQKEGWWDIWQAAYQAGRESMRDDIDTLCGEYELPDRFVIDMGKIR